MGTKRKEIDAYIEKSAEFARPILRKLRGLFHEACPEIEETFKWRFPHFEHRGIVGSMAAFKHHVNYGFWKASLMKDPQGILDPVGETSMGGDKVTSLADLPPDRVLRTYIQEAVRLNVEDVRPVRRAKRAPAKVVLPRELTVALAKNAKARATFEAFPPSHRREYAEWIAEAKRDETRGKRVKTTLEWLAQGKPRHWKYRKA